MIKLRVIQPGKPDLKVEVPDDIATLGRSAECDVTIDEPYISKQHARVFFGTVVVDLESANGTLVGGDRIKEATLLTNDHFTLGGGDVRVELEGMSLSSDDRFALVREQLEDERRKSAELRKQFEGERGRRQSVEGQGSEQVEQLLRDNSDLRQRLETAKRDLERVEKEGAASVEAKLAVDRLQKLRTQNEELQIQIDAAKATAKVATESALALQKENADLRARVTQLESDGGAAAPATPPPAFASDLFSQLQKQNIELSARVKELEARDVPRAAAPPVPAVKPSAPVSFASGSGIQALLKSVVTDDVDGLEPKRTGLVDEFVVLECLRFLRQVERVVTRMAGGFIQLLRMETMLPDVAGNVRELMGAVLANADDVDARDDLIRYLNELRRWMVVSFSADRKAAALFAAEIVEDLSERKLTESNPIPKVKRMAGLADAELWRRATAYLEDLSPDMVEDRIERFARASVQEILDSSDADL